MSAALSRPTSVTKPQCPMCGSCRTREDQGMMLCAQCSHRFALPPRGDYQALHAFTASRPTNVTSADLLAVARQADRAQERLTAALHDLELASAGLSHLGAPQRALADLVRVNLVHALRTVEHAEHAVQHLLTHLHEGAQ